MTHTDPNRAELERLIADRDTWRRVAERLEREKIALAQDVLTHGEKRRAQAEELDRCLRGIRPGATAAVIRESLYHRLRDLRGETAAAPEYRCNRCNAPLPEGPDSPSASVAGRCLYFCDDCIDICDENIEFPEDGE